MHTFCWSTASFHWHNLRQNRNILELEIILLHITWQRAHISRTFYFLVVFYSFQDRNGELSHIPFWYPSTWHDQDWSKHIHFPSKSAYYWIPTRVVRGMGSGETMCSFSLQNFDVLIQQHPSHDPSSYQKDHCYSRYLCFRSTHALLKATCLQPVLRLDLNLCQATGFT